MAIEKLNAIRSPRSVKVAVRTTAISSRSCSLTGRILLRNLSATHAEIESATKDTAKAMSAETNYGAQEMMLLRTRLRVPDRP